MPYDNTDSGVLFREKEKKSEKAPDYRGKLNVAGHDYELAGWIKEGKNGKFLSLKVQEPFKKSEPKAAPVYKGGADDSDSIPF